MFFNFIISRKQEIVAEFHELCFLFKELKTSLAFGALLNVCLGCSCRFTWI